MKHIFNSNVPVEAHQDNILFNTPPVAENIDYLYRNCRHCNKHFVAIKPHYVCCCWQCSHEHKKAMREPDPLDAAYQDHPF